LYFTHRKIPLNNLSTLRAKLQAKYQNKNILTPELTVVKRLDLYCLKTKDKDYESLKISNKCND